MGELDSSRTCRYGEEGLKNGVLEQTEYRGFQYVGDPMKLFYDFFGETSPFSIMVEENSSKFNLGTWPGFSLRCPRVRLFSDDGNLV